MSLNIASLCQYIYLDAWFSTLWNRKHFICFSSKALWFWKAAKIVCFTWDTFLLHFLFHVYYCGPQPVSMLLHYENSCTYLLIIYYITYSQWSKNNKQTRKFSLLWPKHATMRRWQIFQQKCMKIFFIIFLKEETYIEFVRCGPVEKS